MESKDVAILETAIETVTWSPDKGDQGGGYKLAINENPLELQGSRVPGEPAKGLSSVLERRLAPRRRPTEDGSSPSTLRKSQGLRPKRALARVLRRRT